MVLKMEQEKRARTVLCEGRDVSIRGLARGRGAPGWRGEEQVPEGV